MVKPSCGFSPGEIDGAEIVCLAEDHIGFTRSRSGCVARLALGVWSSDDEVVQPVAVDVPCGGDAPSRRVESSIPR